LANAIILSLFRMYDSGHHCSLLSFPTRRSSDLYVQFLHRAGELLKAFQEQFLLICGSFLGPALQHVEMSLSGVDLLLEDILLFRSEEHTSELQSRFDLVCRLLLEKNN